MKIARDFEPEDTNMQQYAEWKADSDFTESSRAFNFWYKASRFFTWVGLLSFIPVTIVAALIAIPHIPPEIVSLGQAGSSWATIQTIMFILPYNWPTAVVWGVVMICYLFMNSMITGDGG